MTEYGKVCLRRGEEKDVRGGRFWIFDNEIDWYDDICPDGGIVDVIDSRMKFVARGYFNSKSKIVVRVLTRDKDEEIDEAFFRRKIQAAWDFRRSLGFENSCRVIFGESDGLPGLTVDKFGDYLSFQIVSLGMERWKAAIVKLLAEVFQPKGIQKNSGKFPIIMETQGSPGFLEETLRNWRWCWSRRNTVWHFWNRYFLCNSNRYHVY